MFIVVFLTEFTPLYSITELSSTGYQNT